MKTVANLISEDVKFNVLTEVCSFVNSEMSYEQQLRAIVETANELMGVKDSFLVTYDEQTQLLHFHLATGEKSRELSELTLEPGQGIAGWVVEHGIPQVVSDVAADPRHNPKISATLNSEIRSIICVPIRSRQKIIGAFEVLNRLDGKPFEEKDVPLLTAFASLIGIVLENARNWRNFEQVNLDLEDLVRTKKQEVKTANKNLMIKTHRLALTTKIISLINSNQNITEIFIEVAKQLQRLIPFNYATVAFVQKDKKTIQLQEIFPSPQQPGSEDITIPFDDPVIRYAVEYKRSLFHNRPRWYHCFLEEGRFLETQLNTMFCTPVTSTDTTVLGTLNLGSIKSQRYTKEAVNIVTFIAKQLGVALERQQLRKALEEANQELNQKTVELRKNIIAIGDANLRLFNTQKRLREKDERMKGLLKEVQEKNEELHNTLFELQQTQTQLVQSEKMASLGQLVAGIAHEINTPAGAIKAASEIIPEYIQKTFTYYEKLLELGMTTEHRTLVLDLVSVMVESARKRERKSTASIREQSKILAPQFKEHGVKSNRIIAKVIARCYLENQIETIFTLFEHYTPKPIMDFLNNCSRLFISSRDNQLSIETISKIIRALKSYSYLDQSQERKVDLNEDIENTLTILHSQIPKNIEVIRKFGSIPKISCLGSELNQVWTNIIQNALQILADTGGTITVETLANSENVIVRITDDGPGIPTEIKNKVFDPFFTTKRGKTSGLGLSVTQQVIDKHHGTINLNSVPGNTTFEIVLPKEGIKFKTQGSKKKKKSTRIAG